MAFVYAYLAESYSAMQNNIPSTLLTSGFAVSCTQRAADGLGGGIFIWNSSDLSGTMVASSVTTTNVSGNVFTKTAHGLKTGQVLLAGSAVNGLSLNTKYWAIKLTADTFSVATSFAAAWAGTAVALTGASNLTFQHLLDPLGGVYVVPTGFALNGSQGAFVRQTASREASPYWFGALYDAYFNNGDPGPTGTDDTEAHSGCLYYVELAAPSNSAHAVLLGAGSTIVSNQWAELANPYWSVSGAPGWGGTVVYYRGAIGAFASPVLHFNAPVQSNGATTTTTLSLKNFTMTATAGASAGICSVAAVRIEQYFNINMTEVFLREAGIGLYMVNCWDGDFYGCKFEFNTTYGLVIDPYDTALGFNGSNNLRFYGFHLEGNFINGIPGGFSGPTTDCLIRASNFIYFYGGKNRDSTSQDAGVDGFTLLGVGSPGTTGAGGGEFIGYHFLNHNLTTSNGVRLGQYTKTFDSSVIQTQGTVFVGCEFDSTQYGISIENATDYVRISDNTFTSALNSAVHWTTTGTNNWFDGLNTDLSAAPEFGRIVTLSSGVIVATNPHHRIDTQGGAASDTCRTINMPVGEITSFKLTNTARVVTFANFSSGADNIRCGATGAGNLLLDDLQDMFTGIRGTTYFTQIGWFNYENDNPRAYLGTQFDVAASTSYASITGLGLPVLTGGTYEFEFGYRVTMDSTGGGKFSFSSGGGITVSAFQCYQTDPGGTGTVYASSTALTTDLISKTGASAWGTWNTVRGTVVVTGFGTLLPRFAQNTASGTSSVLTGSYGLLNRIS